MIHKPIGHGGALIEMEGAIDLHFHSYPCLFPRLADDLEVAIAARDAGFRALVYKCHHESSVTRAYYLNRLVREVRAFGAIVLNSYVGFMNATAVEATLRFGGKVVWMPTIDSGFHAKVHGSTGKYSTQSGGLESDEGYWILDEDDRVKDEVTVILDLVAEYDAILGTSHLSPKEIVQLVPHAHDRGVQRIVITHPFYRVPNLDLDTLAMLVRQGAIAEFEYCGLSPAWHVAEVERVVDAIRKLGAGRCLLVSDAGQRHNPIAPEALRVFAQTVFEKGVAEDDIYRMIKTNPAELLELDRECESGDVESDRWAGLLEGVFTLNGLRSTLPTDSERTRGRQEEEAAPANFSTPDVKRG